MSNHTMPNNYLICSEKFLRTKAPWKLNSSLLGQLSDDHYIASFDSSEGDDKEELVAKIAKSLRASVKGKDISNYVFVGLEKDCALLPALEKQAKIKFNVAFLVNNTEPQDTYKALSKSCVFYNVFTKPQLAGNLIQWAKVNEYVNTKIPAYMSSKVSLSIAGLLTYDYYKLNYLTKTSSEIIELN